MPQRPNTSVDFWKNVQKSDGCWLWTGAVGRSGYGSWRVGGRQFRAHRYSFLLSTGVDPAEMLVCHRCDVRHCVRPDHLFLGTTQDNMTDMVSKGRQARGERNRQHKLTSKEVPEVRSRFKNGESKKSLGRRFGVSDTLVRFIVTGRAWK